MHFVNNDALNKYVSERSGGTALLSFSNGKDSLVAWLVMRRYFTKVIPFFLYRIPGMSFIERSLAYYEDFFKTEIIRLPHPALYITLNNLLYQSPEKCLPIERYDLPEYDYDYVHTLLHEDLFLPKEVYVATGVTGADNMTRRISLKRNGPLNVNRGTFFPIFDHKKADLLRELRTANVKLPIDYHIFGRSFDGYNTQFFAPVKEHYPEDWKRILHWFGQADLDILRNRFREDYYNGTETTDENYFVETEERSD